jgi:hypothetical protein
MSSPHRVIAIVLMAGQLSACTSWRLETLSLADVIRAQHPSQLRVERRDGHREVLHEPEVQGDSLLGRAILALGRRGEDDKVSNRALSLTEITQVATRHVSPGRTAGLVLGIGAILALIAVASANFPISVPVGDLR